MNHKQGSFVRILKGEQWIILGICFGVFLFILFFQPFTAEKFDFNNRLLFIAGYGGITYILLFILRIIIPWLFMRDDHDSEEHVTTSYLAGFILLVLCSVAFTFYTRYVGSVHMSFYIVVKIVLICLALPVALGLYDLNKELIRQNSSLISERKAVQKQIEKYEEDNMNKSIEFISETGSDNLTLLIAEVVFVQSADNYVEIVYMDAGSMRKTLIRNTLKNVELQISPYSNFIRCHRSCIVNKHYIEKLNQSYGSHWLTLKGHQEKIPVSRQYLLKLKEAL